MRIYASSEIVFLFHARRLELTLSVRRERNQQVFELLRFGKWASAPKPATPKLCILRKLGDTFFLFILVALEVWIQADVWENKAEFLQGL